MTAKRILILTEAGKNIGFGHLSRCIALRDELVSRGALVDLVSNTVELTLDNPYVIQGDWLAEERLFFARQGFDVVIVDSYLASCETFKTIRNVFPKTVVIDDYNRLKYPVDLIVNPNVFFEGLDYSNQSASCIGGEDFVILRTIFRGLVKQNELVNDLRHVLITLGGSDFRGLLPVLTNLLLKSDLDTIKVIAPDGMTGSFNDSRLEIVGKQDDIEMHRLINEADFVISACGQSLHELASQGSMVVGICLDIDQEPNQQFYLDRGFLSTKIYWNSINLEQELSSSIEFLKDSKEQIRVRILGPNLINKEGVTNLSKEILNLIHD